MKWILCLIIVMGVVETTKHKIKQKMKQKKEIFNVPKFIDKQQDSKQLQSIYSQIFDQQQQESRQQTSNGFVSSFLSLLQSKHGKIILDSEKFQTEKFEMDEDIIQAEQLLQYFQSHKQKFIRFFERLLVSDDQLNEQQKAVLEEIGDYYIQIQNRYIEIQQKQSLDIYQKKILDNYMKIYNFFNLILNQQEYNDKEQQQQQNPIVPELDMDQLEIRQSKVIRFLQTINNKNQLDNKEDEVLGEVIQFQDMVNRKMIAKEDMFNLIQIQNKQMIDDLLVKVKNNLSKYQQQQSIQQQTQEQQPQNIEQQIVQQQSVQQQQSQIVNNLSQQQGIVPNTNIEQLLKYQQQIIQNLLVTQTKQNSVDGQQKVINNQQRFSQINNNSSDMIQINDPNQYLKEFKQQNNNQNGQQQQQKHQQSQENQQQISVQNKSSSAYSFNEPQSHHQQFIQIKQAQQIVNTILDSNYDEQSTNFLKFLLEIIEDDFNKDNLLQSELQKLFKVDLTFKQIQKIMKYQVDRYDKNQGLEDINKQ